MLFSISFGILPYHFRFVYKTKELSKQKVNGIVLKTNFLPTLLLILRCKNVWTLVASDVIKKKLGAETVSQELQVFLLGNLKLFFVCSSNYTDMNAA